MPDTHNYTPLALAKWLGETVLKYCYLIDEDE